METAAVNAQKVWYMLGDVLKQAEEEALANDSSDTGSVTTEIPGSKTRVQLREALKRVKEVTNKLMTYFDHARGGDSEAGKKALGEDAQLFVKVSLDFHS
jgi:hypothetical protein